MWLTDWHKKRHNLLAYGYWPCGFNRQFSKRSFPYAIHRYIEWECTFQNCFRNTLPVCKRWQSHHGTHAGVGATTRCLHSWCGVGGRRGPTGSPGTEVSHTVNQPGLPITMQHPRLLSRGRPNPRHTTATYRIHRGPSPNAAANHCRHRQSLPPAAAARLSSLLPIRLPPRLRPATGCTH